MWNTAIFFMVNSKGDFSVHNFFFGLDLVSNTWFKANHLS